MADSEDRLDQLLRALGNPARRRIMQMVWHDRRSAGELAESLGLANASVSEHLKVLRKSGLVRVEREATWWYYIARQDTITEFRELMLKIFPNNSGDK